MLEEISLEEIITFSKKEIAPPFVIIDELSDDEFEYAKTIAERLRIKILKVKDSNKIAIVNNKAIALKLARELKKKSQYLYYDLVKRPSANFTMYAMTGYTPSWISLRDNGYVVEAFDEEGKMTTSWIDTNISDVSVDNISKLNLKNYMVIFHIRGTNNAKRSNRIIVDLSRFYYLTDGVFNEQRQCYYPKETKSSQGISGYNRLEKLFKKGDLKAYKSKLKQVCVRFKREYTRILQSIFSINKLYQ